MSLQQKFRFASLLNRRHAESALPEKAHFVYGLLGDGVRHLPTLSPLHRPPLYSYVLLSYFY